MTKYHIGKNNKKGTNHTPPIVFMEIKDGKGKHEFS